MNILNSISEYVGRTPLIRLNNLEKTLNLSANLLAKAECFNPGGSAKDRVALSMIADFEEKGQIKKGSVIIEPTSGNTGIGLACLCAAKGYKAVIVMPDNMSEERIKCMSAYGARVILTPAAEGMSGAIKKAEEINKNTPDSIIAGQFENPANPRAHYQTTGPEIYSDTDGNIDFFVCGIGTGGTISGVAKYLKEQNKDIKIIGVEPADSPLITKGRAAPHKLQGIGANFIPKNLDLSAVDEILTATTEEAYEYARLLAQKEGILSGISAGAALSAAVKTASENQGKTVVVLLPDTGDRYFSTELYQ